jgi:hypothetical protein
MSRILTLAKTKQRETTRARHTAAIAPAKATMPVRQTKYKATQIETNRAAAQLFADDGQPAKPLPAFKDRHPKLNPTAANHAARRGGFCPHEFS